MIKYQSLLPKLEYKGMTLADISHRFSLYDNVHKLSTDYLKINIVDSDTPERLSLKVYGTQDYWWLICAANNVVDPFYDWLMTDDEIIMYCEKVYGDDGMNDIHHYEDDEFNVYEFDASDLNPITNLEHHIHENDKKRRVNIVKPEFLGQLETELNLYIKSLKKQQQG